MGEVNRAVMGARCKAVRETLGMTREAMANVLRCELKYIGALEIGYMELDNLMISILRKQFNIDPGFLRGEDVPMFVKNDEEDDEEERGNCDIVQTLAHYALENGSDLTEGEAYFPSNPKRERVECEEAIKRCVAEYAGDDRDMSNEILDKVWTLQGATELERFEEGMRYGARLVFNLLAGKRGLRAS